jgi:hypothetical protein
MSPIRRALILVVCAALLSACGGGGLVRRVSEPYARIQQMTVRADGSWQVALRIENFSSIPMQFQSLDLAMQVEGLDAGRLHAQPDLWIGPESADVVDVPINPSAAAKLTVAEALLANDSVEYALEGSIAAVPEDSGLRTFELERSSVLSPAPGLPGVLR